MTSDRAKLIFGGAAVAAAAAVGYLLWQKRRAAIAYQQQYPVVEELWVFPIKSCRGFSPKSWEVTERGMQYDREWVLLKEGDPSAIMTLRNCPKMARVVPTIDAASGEMRISFDGDAAGAGTLNVPLVITADRMKADKARIVDFTLWGTKGPCMDEGDAAAAWLSERLGVAVRLYHACGPRDAGVSKRAIMPAGNEVFGQDLASFMIISTQTVDKIRAACGVPEVCAERFRGNMVIDAGAADTEYTYRRLALMGSSIILTFVKHCERCTVPTVDNAGKAHPTYEPTTTLRKKFSAPAVHDSGGKAKPLAGINLYHEGTGRVWVGMRMEVLDVGTPPVFTSAE